MDLGQADEPETEVVDEEWEERFHLLFEGTIFSSAPIFRPDPADTDRISTIMILIIWALSFYVWLVSDPMF